MARDFNRIASALLAAMMLAAVAGGIVGCGRPDSGDSAAGSQQSGSATQAAVEAMPIEIRNVQLPKGFPVEVPVPDGRVSTADVQSSAGQEAWVYDMTVVSPVAAVADWYSGAYANANWVLSSRRPGAGGGDSVTLVFAKGDAESAIALGSAPGSTTRVQASIGIGVPVTGTY